MRARDNIPLECEITKAIQRYLRNVPDWWGFKVFGSAQQQTGIPDIIGCYKGLFVALEVKRPKLGKLSKIQAHMIDRIKSAGGRAYVVHGVDEVEQIIAALAAAERGEGRGAAGGPA